MYIHTNSISNIHISVKRNSVHDDTFTNQVVRNEDELTGEQYRGNEKTKDCDYWELV